MVKKHAIFTKDNDKFVLVLRIKDKDFYPKNPVPHQCRRYDTSINVVASVPSYELE